MGLYKHPRWPNYPLSLNGKSCALAPLNMIPKFPKEKYQFQSDLSSKSSTFMCFIYMIFKRYQAFCENFVNEKMAYVTNPQQKGEGCQRLLLTWRLGPAHMAEGGHHLRNAPNPHPRSEWGISPKFFRRRVYLMEHSLRIPSIFPILVPYCDPVDLGSRGIISAFNGSLLSNFELVKWVKLVVSGHYARHGLKFGTLSYTDYHSLKLTIFCTQQQFKFVVSDYS